MMASRFPSTLAALLLAAVPAVVSTQSLDPSKIPFGETPRDIWPTYYGDYSGRRYSPLDQIHQGNVKSLSLAWVYRANPSSSPGNVGGFGPETGSIGIAAARAPVERLRSRRRSGSRRPATASRRGSSNPN